MKNGHKQLLRRVDRAAERSVLFKIKLEGGIVARKNESLLNLLTRVPWWISVAVAAVAYVFLKFIVPSLPIDVFGGNPFASAARTFAPIVALLCLLAGAVSAFKGWRKGRMLDSQKNIETVGNLNWKEFEELISEIYRRQGYFVLENPNEGADGGVDLRLRKDGKKIYVQCKHWKERQVGVKVVRELYGVMMAKSADEGVAVTYGTFTQEARDFATDKPISLVDGKRLVGLIAEVQKTPKLSIPEKSQKTCPKCGSGMVLRTAKRGSHAGQKFWGCTGYPGCRTVLQATTGGEER